MPDVHMIQTRVKLNANIPSIRIKIYRSITYNFMKSKIYFDLFFKIITKIDLLSVSVEEILLNMYEGHLIFILHNILLF
jgi:hypothetical protein